MRLFLCACFRSEGSTFDERARPAAETAERLADGQAGPEECRQARAALAIPVAEELSDSFILLHSTHQTASASVGISRRMRRG